MDLMQELAPAAVPSVPEERDVEKDSGATKAAPAAAPASYALGALFGRVPPPAPTRPKVVPSCTTELRVVIVTPSLFVPDGVSLTLLKLARYVKSQGGKVCFLTTKPLGPAPDLPQDMDIIFAPGLAVPISGQQASYQLGAMLNAECEDEVRRFGPNVVHLSVPDWNGLGMAKMATELGAALLCTYHSNYGDYLRFYSLGFARAGFNTYLTHFYTNTPVLYAPTPYIQEKLKADGIGDVTNVQVWGRGVDFQLFHPSLRSERFRSRYGLEATDVVVLWVGRLVKEKRPDIFIDVVERLNAEGHACKGLVVGTGAFEQQMSESPDIVTAGFLSGAALATAYASSDLLLFPSTVETFGNVTLESLAAGCPVVVDSNCSGHLVQAGVNGEAVTPEEAEEGYYAATKRLVTNDQYREMCAVSARESVSDFAAEVIQQRMVDNYLEMAKANGAGAPEATPACHKTETARVSSERLYMLWRLVFVFVYPVLTVIVGVANCVSLCECSPFQKGEAGSKGKTTELRLETIDESDADMDSDDDIESGRGLMYRNRHAKGGKPRTLSADLVLAQMARGSSFGVVSIFHLQDRRRIALVLLMYGSLLVGMTWLLFNM